MPARHKTLASGQSALTAWVQRFFSNVTLATSFALLFFAVAFLTRLYDWRDIRGFASIFGL